jgi:NAD+ kinase
MHEAIPLNKPIYGMNLGSVGFMLNNYSPDFLFERIEKALSAYLNPLQMEARTADGETHTALAINEVSLWRNSRQAAKISIDVDNVNRLGELICDGVMISTPAEARRTTFRRTAPFCRSVPRFWR